MTKFREVSSEDRKNYGIILLIYIAAAVVSMFFLLPEYWYVVLAILIAGALLMTGLTTRDYGARCANCGNEFELSFTREVLAPHGGGRSGSWQYVKCPNCGKRTRALVVKKVTEDERVEGQ
jgi:DNA-directed RNA polymerase subunit RPC12/RpoP